MIKSIGQMVSSSVDLAKLREGGKTKATAAVAEEIGQVRSFGSSALTPSARMAAGGAPVDMDRVSAIKEAIASGNYPVNAQRIAERMIALDLGE